MTANPSPSTANLYANDNVNTENKIEDRNNTHFVLEQIWVAVHKIPVALSAHFILQVRKKEKRERKRES